MEIPQDAPVADIPLLFIPIENAKKLPSLTPSLLGR